MANELIIAAAGSGKTTHIIQRALEVKDENVLITTYTEVNELEIKKKFIELYGCVPAHVTIQTWFSLLIQHGVKPYQSYLYEQEVKGLILVSQKSGLRGRNRKGFPIYFAEDKYFNRHYFSTGSKIYSDKLSKFVVRVNQESEGLVLDRLNRIYPNIFIDESQDLAGYDLELVKLLAKSPSELVMVCDPRQVTYLTHNESKHSNYKNGQLEQFIIDKCKGIDFSINQDSLSYSYRCNQLICDYSNLLYPKTNPAQSAQELMTGHDGIFLLTEEESQHYLEEFNPVQLRWDNRNTKIDPAYPALNFGVSKGMTFDRVLIYPTEGMLQWMKNHNSNLSQGARAKLYVGLTRARFSVGIVCDTLEEKDMQGISIYRQA